MASSSVTPPARKAFSALGLPGYRVYLITFSLTMMADNVEHVISYWVAFQKFHSAALGGFAVVSHWLPYLFLSVFVGALNDRRDSRRLIQAGAILFMVVSAGWGYFFVTDSLEMWHAMILLVLHGCAGVLWMTSSQVLLYDIVGPTELPSAVRLAATARYFGVLVGPGVGSVILLTLGPERGMFFNVLFYLPLVIWLVRAPYGRFGRAAAARRAGASAAAQAALPRAVVVDAHSAPRRVRGLDDIIRTLGEVRQLPVLLAMIILAGSASFFVGNSYQAQMPEFARDLGHGDPGTSYTVLLAADAAGAFLAGLLLESRGGIFRVRASSAMALAMAWTAVLFGFALTHDYPVAIVLLFFAGFFELSFSSMAQTLVQVHAPEASRGKVLGLYNMASSGLRMFSGITVGLAGSALGIHSSLAIATALLFFGLIPLLLRARTAVPPTTAG